MQSKKLTPEERDQLIKNNEEYQRRLIAKKSEESAIHPHKSLHTVILKSGRVVMVDADDMQRRRLLKDNECWHDLTPPGIEGCQTFYLDGHIAANFLIEDVACWLPPIGWSKIKDEEFMAKNSRALEDSLKEVVSQMENNGEDKPIVASNEEVDILRAEADCLQSAREKLQAIDGDSLYNMMERIAKSNVGEAVADAAAKRMLNPDDDDVNPDIVQTGSILEFIERNC